MRVGMVVCLGAAVVVAMAGAANAQAAGGQARLDDTLRRLDAASANFKSAQAQYSKQSFHPPIPDADVENGQIYFVHEGSATRMGAVSTGAGAHTVEYKNGIVRLYQPGLGCYKDYGGGKDKARIESFLTLGFGGSGQNLRQSWEIKDDGPETLPGQSKPAEKLELVGREQSVRDQVKLITIWVDPDRAVSLRQDFEFSSGDRQTALYTKIDTKAKLDMGAFAIPSDAKVKDPVSGKVSSVKVGPCH